MITQWNQNYIGDSYKRLIGNYKAVIIPCANCWDWYIVDTEAGGSAESFEEAEKSVLEWIDKK
jgi:hypothetical protein